jgi:hypothetical protein
MFGVGEHYDHDRCLTMRETTSCPQNTRLETASQLHPSHVKVQVAAPRSHLSEGAHQWPDVPDKLIKGHVKEDAVDFFDVDST